MKNWFSILSGKTTSTPGEIAGEIEKLQAEQADVMARLAAAQETLETARLELYGGQGKQADVDTQERGVKALQTQADTLSRALADLDVKHREAQAQERQKQIDDLNKQIADLKQWGQELRPQYIKAKVMVEAYERILEAPLPPLPVGMPAVQHFLITGHERAAHKAEVEKITGGFRGSIAGRLAQLRQQRDSLVKQ